jgi:hypothetical protein
MKDCLPPNALKQKLPRFLQKCTQSFASDRRYRNDPRYLRVWLQLVISKPVSLFFFLGTGGCWVLDWIIMLINLILITGCLVSFPILFFQLLFGF